MNPLREPFHPLRRLRLAATTVAVVVGGACLGLGCFGLYIPWETVIWGSSAFGDAREGDEKVVLKIVAAQFPSPTSEAEIRTWAEGLGGQCPPPPGEMTIVCRFEGPMMGPLCSGEWIVGFASTGGGLSPDSATFGWLCL